MTKSRQGALKYGLLVGFLSALLFTALGFAGLFVSLEYKLYDFFLRYRPRRERSDLIVFLDVDKGPQGVDNISLEVLPLDFYRTFSGLDSGMSDVINGLFDGHLSKAEALGFFSSYIDDERDQLLRKALNVARDNDEYLARASALFGNSWATVNLREHLLEGEQASRQAMAEELFSYPVKTNLPVKSSIKSIMPPIPSFAKAAKGAGFTRAFVDRDGVRRRIDLVQEFNGFWYLQLSLAPLVNYLGDPAIELKKNRLVLRNASYPPGSRYPSGITKDLTIPLDANGRMLLDWPVTSFEESFEHFSFAYISALEYAQAEIEHAISILSFSENLYNLIAWDYSLAEVPALLYRIVDLFDTAGEERARALTDVSDEAFAEYLSLRNEAWDLLYRFRDIGFADKINAIGEELARNHPGKAGIIRNESACLENLARNILYSLEDFDTIQGKLKNAPKGKYCIVGQTDVGTTDIGVNPFYSEYVNVGTQGAIIDTILSESFIVWLSPWWNAMLCILTTLFLFMLTNLAPAMRSALGFLSAMLVFLFTFLLFR